MKNINPSLGIVLSTVTDASPQELIDTASHAEKKGFDAVFINEGRGDALASVLAIALNTDRISLGTNIANIYYRHPYLAAATARTIAELSNGRLLLGFGMSHRQMLKSLNIDMGDARANLEAYVSYVKQALAGEAGQGFLKPQASRFDVPVYVAGNTVESARLAARVGDGLMPFLSPRSYLPSLLSAAAETAGQENFPCILSIPTFLSDDVSAARSAARYNLAFFAQLPNYRRQWRRAGFGAIMNAVKTAGSSQSRREIAALIPDELVDEVCVYGTLSDCQTQLDGFREAGVSMPVLAVSPVNTDRLAATISAIDAFAATTG